MFALSPPSRGAQAGQGLVEYSLILVLIAIVAIASLAFFGHVVSGMLSMIGNSV
jgi:Flp pilus assembly pilin Flp